MWLLRCYSHLLRCTNDFVCFTNDAILSILVSGSGSVRQTLHLLGLFSFDKNHSKKNPILLPQSPITQCPVCIPVIVLMVNRAGRIRFLDLFAFTVQQHRPELTSHVISSFVKPSGVFYFGKTQLRFEICHRQRYSSDVRTI